MILTKRIRISIRVVLTLIAACAWEASWFGKRNPLTLSITSPESAETRR